MAGCFIAFVERIQLSSESAVSVRCRDPKDQVFLGLAFEGKADVLVISDEGRLTMAGMMPFAIEPPAAYKQRMASIGFPV